MIDDSDTFRKEQNMHVFITGGTGFIGSAIIRELTAAGHVVTGLARTPEASVSAAYSRS